MFLTLVIEIQWLTHAAVARPAAFFYQGQFDPDSIINIDLIAMLYMVVFIVMSLPASYIIDTFGIRAGLSVGALLTLVFSLTKAYGADSFKLVVLSQTGLAVAQPFILNSVTAVTARWFPLKERALMAGLLSLAQYLGILTAMLVIPTMIGSDPSQADYGQGFQSMLLVFGWISAAAALLVLLFFKENKNPGAFEYERSGFIPGLKQMSRNRDMIIMLVLFLIGLGVFNAVSSMTDAIAAEAGVDDSDGLIGGMMLIGGIIGAVVIPALSDHFQKRRLFMVICMAGMIPGFIGLGLTPLLTDQVSLVYWVSVASPFLLGFFVMSAGPVGFQYAAEINRPAPESASQGLLLWAGQITGMLFVAGMSINHHRYLPHFMIAFIILSFITLILVTRLRESGAMQQ